MNMYPDTKSMRTKLRWSPKIPLSKGLKSQLIVSKMRENFKDLVSIIMNCHNGEKYLKQSISSIVSQTYSNWELIFWDNLSKDESKNIVKDFNDDRIKYHSSKNFLKLYDARNHAIKQATGKYIAFLDTDDYWIKDKLKNK